MTRQEAKRELELIKSAIEWDYPLDGQIALDMAIEALEQEPIIYCKDCKHWHEWENGAGSCHRSDIMWVGSDYYDYCSFAERKEQ